MPATTDMAALACTAGRWPAYLTVGKLPNEGISRQGRRRYKQMSASVRQAKAAAFSA